MALPPARGVQRLSDMPAKGYKRACIHTEAGQPCCQACANPLRFLRRFASRHVITRPMRLHEVHRLTIKRRA